MKLCCQVNGHNPKRKCSICGQMLCDDCWQLVKRLPNDKYTQARKYLNSLGVYYYADGRMNGVSIKPMIPYFQKKLRAEVRNKLSELGTPHKPNAYWRDDKRIEVKPYRYFFERKYSCTECYKKEVK